MRCAAQGCSPSTRRWRRATCCSTWARATAREAGRPARNRPWVLHHLQRGGRRRDCRGGHPGVQGLFRRSAMARCSCTRCAPYCAGVSPCCQPALKGILQMLLSTSASGVSADKNPAHYWYSPPPCLYQSWYLPSESTPKAVKGNACKVNRLCSCRSSAPAHLICSGLTCGWRIIYAGNTHLQEDSNEHLLGLLLGSDKCLRLQDIARSDTRPAPGPHLPK